jgi:hypothetical protein
MYSETTGVNFMQTAKRVIVLAQEEANSGFASLATRMVGEAEMALADAQRAAPADEQRYYGLARHFLREEGRMFLSQIQSTYAGFLERAMQTMHKDLRTGLHEIDANTLTLIDDEVVTRQIEVDRLVLRLRDADELSLGHLNLMIAQLHGDSEVRERENPFRPYLLARALYDVLRNMVQDEATSKVLFDALAATMTEQLAGFYARLREVFESRGVRSKLVARPTALTRREREKLAWQRAADGAEDADAAIISRMQRLLELQKTQFPQATRNAAPANDMPQIDLPPHIAAAIAAGPHGGTAGQAGRTAQGGGAGVGHSGAGGGGYGGAPTHGAHAGMAAPATRAGMPGAAGTAPQGGMQFQGNMPAQGGAAAHSDMQGPPSLLPEITLTDFGHGAPFGAASAPAEAAAMPPAHNLQELVWSVFNQPKALHQPRQAPDLERRAQLDHELRELQNQEAGDAADSPLALREKLSGATTQQDRLTIDLVALLFEFIMNDDQLPAMMRLQLCRLHTPFLRAALQKPDMLHDAQHPARLLLDRIGSAVAGMRENNPLYTPLLRQVARLIDDLIKRYENKSDVFAETAQALDAYLIQLLRDSDAVTTSCVQAFERADRSVPLLASARQLMHQLLEPLTVDRRMIDFLTGSWMQVMVHTFAREPVYRALLPELVWSAQERPAPDERSVLMKVLPDLGRRLRAGLSLIGVADDKATAVLDELLSLHMDVLGNKQLSTYAVRMSLTQLREHFSKFKLDEMAAALQDDDGRLNGPLPGRPEIVAELAAYGIDAIVHADPEVSYPQAGDEEWLAWAHPGTAFEMIVDDRYAPIRLSAVGRDNGLFLFSVPDDPRPLVYTRAALLAAMHEGELRPYEYAPLFDRAVESLMTGAATLATG